MADKWIRNTLDGVILPRYDGYVEKNAEWYNTNGAPYTKVPACYRPIKGTNTSKRAVGREGANVLDNCTGFAVCAFNEAYYENKVKEMPTLPKKQYFYFQRAANKIIAEEVNRRNSKGKLIPTRSPHPAIKEGLMKYKDLSACFVPPSGTPPIGGLVCWGGGGACHVAHIVDVTEDGNKMKVVQSGWGTPGWTTVMPKGYKVNQSTLVRDCGGHKNLWWYNGPNLSAKDKAKVKNGAKCQGFIINPAIDLLNIVGYKPPVINKVIQVNPTTIKVEGERKEDPPYATHTRIYYKWDSDQVTTEDYDGHATSEDPKFKLEIKKPRDATSVALIPVQLNNGTLKSKGILVHKKSPDIYPSYPCIPISDGTEFKESIPYIYDSSTKKWNKVTPTIRQNGNWYEIYNTGKEKVK